jgi:hypothetical protein
MSTSKSSFWKALVLTASSCSATVDSRSVSFQNYFLLSLLSGFSTLRFVTCLFDKSNNCASQLEKWGAGNLRESERELQLLLWRLDTRLSSWRVWVFPTHKWPAARTWIVFLSCVQSVCSLEKTDREPERVLGWWGMGASSKFFKTLVTMRRIVKSSTSSVEKDDNVSL